jgi:PLP dependent protein
MVGAGRTDEEAPFPRLLPRDLPAPFRSRPVRRTGEDPLVEREQLQRNVEEVRARIARAAERSGRDPSEVRMIAVAKTVPPEPVRWAVEAGVRDVGENYAQELRRKRAEVYDATWHYVGTLSSGGARAVADLADVVHSLAGERATRRLAGRAARDGRILDGLLEVDFTGERSGVAPDDVGAFADLVASLNGLRLVGVMTIPPIASDPEASRPYFVRLRALRDDLRERHPEVLESSMGMSLDYEVAVEEGATMVRIGTALFGPRTSRPGGSAPGMQPGMHPGTKERT